jgi:L-2-hydroxyglutarate oxidase LhgO
LLKRLSKTAKQKFDEAGWTDEIKVIANRTFDLLNELMKGYLKTMDTIKFSALSEAVKPDAEKALNSETRRELLIMVAGVVRQIITEAEQE